MIAAPAKTITRLAAICGRLASDHDGERAAAGLLASRIIAEAGFTWRDLIERAFTEQSAQSFEPAPIDADLTLRLYRSLLAESWLNPWERGFVSSLLEKEAVSLSHKQQRCLNIILRKAAGRH